MLLDPHRLLRKFYLFVIWNILLISFYFDEKEQQLRRRIHVCSDFFFINASLKIMYSNTLATSIPWVLIGTLIGLVVLAVSLSCCCIFWHCCWLVLWRALKDLIFIVSQTIVYYTNSIFSECCLGAAVYEHDGIFEYYYIDHCTDRRCLYFEDFTRSQNSFVDRSLTQSAHTSNSTARSSSTTTAADEPSLDMINLQCDSFVSMFSEYSRRKSKSRVSISRVKRINRKESLCCSSLILPIVKLNRKRDNHDDDNLKAENPVRISRLRSRSILQRHRSFRLEQERICIGNSLTPCNSIELDSTSGVVDKKNSSNAFQLKNNQPLNCRDPSGDNTQIERIKSTAKPRRFSSFSILEIGKLVVSRHKTNLKSKRLQESNLVRVTRILSPSANGNDQPLSGTDEQSIINGTITLDSLDTTRNAARSSSSSKCSSDTVHVEHVPLEQRPKTKHQSNLTSSKTNNLPLEVLTSATKQFNVHVRFLHRRKKPTNAVNTKEYMVD